MNNIQIIARMIYDHVCPNCGHEDDSVHICKECIYTFFVCSCCQGDHKHFCLGGDRI